MGHLNCERFVWSIRDGKGLTWLLQTVGDEEKLLTHLNSALKVLLGLDIFPSCAKKKVKFCCPVKYVNTHIFSQLTWLSQTNCG
jgi:hypothetical protein